jgi:hypothetical protein
MLSWARMNDLERQARTREGLGLELVLELLAGARRGYSALEALKSLRKGDKDSFDRLAQRALEVV